MIYTKKYTGHTPDTPENIASDAGAIFVNFDFDTDTYDSALAAGKVLGTTQGAIQFSAVPTYRQPQINGIKGKTKGLEFIEMWEVSLSGNIFTVTKDAIVKALAAADADIDTEDFYDIITAREYVKLTDYLDNIVYVGRISGTQNPIIIELKNVLNLVGLVSSFADGADTVIPVNFSAHKSFDNPDEIPFAIYRPKAEGTVSGTVTDTGAPVDGATVTVTIDGVTLSATTAATTGAFTIEGVPYSAIGYTVTATKGAKTGTAASGEVVGGEDTAVGAIAIS